MPRNRPQLSPTNSPVTFKFWSDSNLTNFKRDMIDFGIRVEDGEPSTLMVYDDSLTVKRIAMDYGADTY